MTTPDPDRSDSPPPPRGRLEVVLNREAGSLAGLDARKVVDRLGEILGSAGWEVSVRAVPAAGVGSSLDEAVAGPAEVIVVGGGDGTVATAVSRMTGRDKVLGILPLGTFNFAARDLGFSLDWEEAAEALARGRESRIDVLRVGGDRCLSLVLLGFYPALVMSRKPDRGGRLGRIWRNTRDLFRHYPDFTPLDLVLRDETGQTLRHRSRLVVIANNDYADLFGLIPRRETLDAGYFTVYLSKHHGRSALLRSLLSWILGHWKQDRELERFRATGLEIRARGRRRLPVMRDGEFENLELPLEVELEGRALRVLLPEAEEGRAGGEPSETDRQLTPDRSVSSGSDER